MSIFTRRLCARATRPATVAIVYGSFEKGYAKTAASAIRRLAPTGLNVLDPQAGDEFNFDSLAETQFLVLCTSSQNGYPPLNLSNFAHQLLLAVDTGEPGCLSHLQHAVWGEGDERWFKTFMNVPRFLDLMLEECGSQRFYARGEANEPHAPTDMTRCEVEEWAPAMWDAAMRRSSDRGAAAPEAVAWDAQWAVHGSPHHHDVSPFDLEALVRRQGEPKAPPSIFAQPDDIYLDMLAKLRREREEREARMRERRARAAAK